MPRGYVDSVKVQPNMRKWILQIINIFSRDANGVWHDIKIKLVSRKDNRQENVIKLSLSSTNCTLENGCHDIQLH